MKKRLNSSARLSKKAAITSVVLIHNKHDLKSPVTMVFGDHAHETKFIKELLKPENHKHLDAWVKSTSLNFYGIDYAWKKGQHPKRGKFNPDMFIKVGDLVVVVEIKDAAELASPSPENVKKNQYAVSHFARVNTELKKAGEKRRYIPLFGASRFPGFLHEAPGGRYSELPFKAGRKAG